MIASNLIHFSPYEYGLDFEGLIIFALGSIVAISILLFYYNRIPKSSQSKSDLETPIYQSKDILLQSNNFDANFITVEKTTSNWVKVIVYILISIVVFTPLYQLFGIKHFI